MSTQLEISVDDFSAAGLASVVNCAVAIAAADGHTDGAEYQELTRHLCALLGDAETVEDLAGQALVKVATGDRDAIFQEAKNMLEPRGREACFTIACAIATRSGGIGMKEGLALQALARTLEIGYPSAKYNELLGKGMRAGRS